MLKLMSQNPLFITGSAWYQCGNGGMVVASVQSWTLAFHSALPQHPLSALTLLFFNFISIEFV